MKFSRLSLLLSLSGLALTLLTPLSHAASEPEPRPTQARLLLGGNFPDPTILRHEDHYYLTHSSFSFLPGLLIWKSRDFQNWKPVTYALKNFEGSVWAPELVHHKGLFYLYFPGIHQGKSSNWVTTAKSIEGPWSEPKSIGVGHIDPGHVAGPTGQRYMHLSGGHVAELSPDGTEAAGKVRKVHKGWPIPKDWAIECFCLESPKLTVKDDWFYLTCAQGGTFGPSTSHMVTSFRSKTPVGPWENSPHNPVIRTWSRDETWWSKGHGSLVEGPNGQWFCVFHGIRNGHRTGGRYTLLEPIEWTRDGWYRVPDRWPEGWDKPFQFDLELTTYFDGRELGPQWQFFRKQEPGRFRKGGGKLILQGRGDRPGNSFPLTVIPRDLAYVIEAELEVSGDSRAGLMLFVHPGQYLGLSLDEEGRIRREQNAYRRYGNTDQPRIKRNRVHFRIVNDRQDVRFYYRNGNNWVIMQPSMEISQGGTVRPALFVTGSGQAIFDSFRYQALP